MPRKAKTDDERLILAIYELACRHEDLQTPLNRYEAGRLGGLQPKKVDAICKLLIQANFIKKGGPEEIILTSHGEGLALRLLKEI